MTDPIIAYLGFLILPAIGYIVTKRKNIHIMVSYIIVLGACCALLSGAHILEERKEKRELEQMLERYNWHSGGVLPKEAQAQLDMWTHDNYRIFIPAAIVLISGSWVTLNFGLFTLIIRLFLKPNQSPEPINEK